MRKFFYYFAALLASVSLMCACSDDENESWKSLPTTPIEVDGTNATMTVNGETSTTGQVTFQAESDTRATLTLTNVIGGYPDLQMPVNMTLSNDGNSFSFTGSTTVNTAPETRSVAAEPALLTVDAAGTISLDGKLSLDLTAYGPGLNLGTYTETTLTLTYGESAMMGGTVYYTLSGTTPVLTLENIIPGEQTASIEGVYTGENGVFSGSATTQGGATVEYDGTVSVANGMTLTLNVTMPDALGLAGTYGWTPIENNGDYQGRPAGMPSASGFYIDVVDDNGLTGGDNSSLCYIVRPLLGGILPQALRSITLSADGNIRADYSSASVAIPLADEFDLSDPTQQMNWMYAGIMMGGFTQEKLDAMLSGRSYQSSPANLAYWFVRDGQLYVKLNIAAVISQAMADSGMTGNGLDLSAIINLMLDTDAQGLRELLSSLSGMMGNSAELVNLIAEKADDNTLNTLLDWVKTGIPLNVESVDGHMRLYLDREDLDMFIQLLKDPEIYAAITAMVPAEAQMATGFIYQICNDWDNLSTFNVGLDLIKQ